MKKILNYRNVWLGFALIWIMWYHSQIILPYKVIQFIKTVGYGGVDICLFASGVGCYFSLDRDYDILNFIKRRLSRLIPTYWLFLIVWIGYKSFSGHLSVQAIVGNVFAVQNFTGLGSDFNWYISAIMLMYFLAPYFKEIVDRTEEKKQLLVVGLLIMISIPFWNSENLIITISRIPIYYIGMFFGKRLTKNDEFTRKEKGFLLLGIILGIIILFIALVKLEKYLWSHALYWYPFILMAPGICIGISWLSIRIEKVKVGRWILKNIENIGKNSFELFLIHIFLFDLTMYFISEKKWFLNSNFIWLCAVFGSVIGCMILKYSVSRAVELAQNFKNSCR